MFYVITPPDATAWHVTRDELLSLLRRDWPGVKVALGGTEGPKARDVVWEVRVDNEELEGSQDRAGQAHYLEGPIRAIAGFAAWWRRQVTLEQPLILCDESYTTVVELRPDTSETDLLAALQ